MSLILCIGALGVVLAIVAILLPDRRRDRPSRDRSHEPQHAALPKRPVPSHARTTALLADPRDRTDPDGSPWLQALSAPVQGSPLESLPPFARRERPPLDVLEKVRTGLLAMDALPAAGELGMLPPDPPAESTGEIPHAVGTWGKTARELADELAAEHLGGSGGKCAA